MEIAKSGRSSPNFVNLSIGRLAKLHYNKVRYYGPTNLWRKAKYLPL